MWRSTWRMRLKAPPSWPGPDRLRSQPMPRGFHDQVVKPSSRQCGMGWCSYAPLCARVGAWPVPSASSPQGRRSGRVVRCAAWLRSHHGAGRPGRGHAEGLALLAGANRAGGWGIFHPCKKVRGPSSSHGRWGAAPAPHLARGGYPTDTPQDGIADRRPAAIQRLSRLGRRTAASAQAPGVSRVLRVVGVAPFSQSRHERDRQPPFHLKRSDRPPDVRRLQVGLLIAGRPGVAPQHRRPANPCFSHSFHTDAHRATARNASGQEKAP